MTRLHASLLTTPSRLFSTPVSLCSYDEGTGTVLLSGRGDTTIRIFELGPSCDKLNHCSDVLVHPLCARSHSWKSEVRLAQ